MNKPQYPTLILLPDELRGPRILLRAYRAEDAQALYEAVAESREHIRPYLPFADAHQSVEESLDWINHQAARWLLREDMNMGIWRITDAAKPARFLGGIGMHPHDWQIGYFEIGYWLRASEIGHGYMTEAVRLLTDYIFAIHDANRVEIRCDARNISSAGVAKRLGFVQEAVVRNRELAPDGTLRTMLYFSRIPTDPPMPTTSPPRGDNEAAS